MYKFLRIKNNIINKKINLKNDFIDYFYYI